MAIFFDNHAIEASSKTWNLPKEKVTEIFYFTEQLICGNTVATMGECAKIIDKKFDNTQEVKCALFECGKLLGGLKVLGRIEKEKEKSFSVPSPQTVIFN